MVFNWFRRQNKKSSDTSSEQKHEQEIEQVSTESTEESQPAQNTEDLLAFAKAAYKNIQDKQQTTEVSTEVEETSEEVAESPPEATEVISESEEVVESSQEATEVVSESEEVNESSQEATEVVAESEEVTESSQEATEVISESEEVVEESIQPQPEEITETTESEVETPDAEVIEEDVISEVETEKISQPAAPLSFLERARAEREARQERLVKSAIEVPETSDVEQPAALSSNISEPVEAVEETPELAFDEGFLWSTEVLAAQGRRAEDVSIEEINWLKKLRQGLDKTRRNVVNQLKAIVGKRTFKCRCGR